MPNHGKEKSCSDKETGDGAIGENNLRTRHKSRPRERTCHNALLATPMRNFNDSDETNLRDCSQSDIGQAKDVWAPMNTFKKLQKIERVAKMQSKANE